MLKVFDRILGLFSNDIGIDLGTANTLVYAKGRGIICSEPSVVAVDTKKHRVRAVGTEAKSMLGRTPGSIRAARPVRDGVLPDVEIAEAMLRYFIQKAHNRSALLRPRIVISVPSGITEVEKRAVRESALSASAREVYLLDEAMAAAIGAGLPIMEPSGNMIVDIGGGTTEVAIISLAGIVYADSARVGGDRMDEAIPNYIKRKYNLLIGERTAERIKIDLGTAWPVDDDRTMLVKGRDLLAGIPKSVEVDTSDVREALADPIDQIVEATKIALERTPPELSADIADKGIVLTGGGAMIDHLDVKLKEETGLPIMLAEDPFTAVVIGCGRCLDEIDLLGSVTERA